MRNDYNMSLCGLDSRDQGIDLFSCKSSQIRGFHKNSKFLDRSNNSSALEHNNAIFNGPCWFPRLVNS